MSADLENKSRLSVIYIDTTKHTSSRQRYRIFTIYLHRQCYEKTHFGSLKWDDLLIYIYAVALPNFIIIITQPVFVLLCISQHTVVTIVIYNIGSGSGKIADRESEDG